MRCESALERKNAEGDTCSSMLNCGSELCIPEVAAVECWGNTLPHALPVGIGWVKWKMDGRFFDVSLCMPSKSKLRHDPRRNANII